MARIGCHTPSFSPNFCKKYLIKKIKKENLKNMQENHIDRVTNYAYWWFGLLLGLNSNNQIEKPVKRGPVLLKIK
jgi:hypothetical protein